MKLCQDLFAVKNIRGISATVYLSYPQPNLIGMAHLAKGSFVVVVVHGPLTVVASPVAEHRLQTRRLSSHGSRAQPLCIALLFVTKVVASGAIHLIFLFILYPHKMSIARRNTTRKHFYPSQTRNLNFMGPSLPHWSEGQSA